MTPERTPELFDQWAADYDDMIGRWSGSFPFIGYEDVLNRIVELADPKPGMKILDVGTGTGALAEKFVRYDCELWGLDYSQKMLEKASKLKLFYPPHLRVNIFNTPSIAAMFLRAQVGAACL